LKNSRYYTHKHPLKTDKIEWQETQIKKKIDEMGGLLDLSGEKPILPLKAKPRKDVIRVI
jgi:hypothetical protein